MDEDTATNGRGILDLIGRGVKLHACALVSVIGNVVSIMICIT